MEIERPTKRYFERNGFLARETPKEEGKRIERLHALPVALRQTVSSSYATPTRNWSETFCDAVVDKPELSYLRQFSIRLFNRFLSTADR